ncbi:MAG: YIP1 family protein [Gammaproteobacteria bacterium]|uniref:Yip1 family protein n=1 Tax=Pseudomaricurvus alcaniphilus TaxID=1166482 RepID=UPI001409C9EB|nr:Yip1 family protein [Pseudomaricurvus alcaniphilus]MBR9910555.1 YIP1 family protein [Gammaproteobacteria bacterium]NHN39646.1 YIP1 family protein [Pseudomaricurvus alcaniphilus]
MAILEHTLGILLHPDSEWKAIRNERHSFLQVFLSHVPFLALIPPLATYYGVTQVGWVIGDGERVWLTSESALSLCAATYVAFLVGVYVLGEFINWMAKTYGVKDGEEKRHYEGTALAVYITVPVFLVGIFGVYPDLWLNAIVTVIAGCYSVYLVYEGIPILMNIPKERAFMYATSVVTVGLVMMVVVRVGSVIVWSIGIGPVYVT